MLIFKRSWYLTDTISIVKENKILSEILFAFVVFIVMLAILATVIIRKKELIPGILVIDLDILLVMSMVAYIMK